MRRWTTGIATTAAILATVAAAWAGQQAWKRYYVGSTALSVEAPVAIGAGVPEKVDDPKDWVSKMTDYMVELPGYYLQITVFEGKEGTKADYTKLAAVMKDTVEVFADDAYTTAFTPSEDGKGGTLALNPIQGKTPKAKVTLDASLVGQQDGQPALLADMSRVQGNDKSVLKFRLIGDGNTVYAIFGIGFPDDAEGMKGLDRILKSLRYKKGL